MFIQTEPTPNPETLKFLPGREIAPDQPREFATPEEAEESRLAKELFAVEGVIRVFAGMDFVSVTKAEGVEWAHIRPQVLGAITDVLESGEPLFGKADAGPGHADSDHPIVKEIVEISTRACGRMWPRTAGTSPSIPMTRTPAGSICTCAALARAARPRP